MQIAAIVIGLAVTAAAIALVTRTVMNIRRVIMVGQPAPPARYEGKGDRVKNLLLESLGHTRLMKWGVIGALHLVVFVGFGYLFFSLVTAYGQLFDPEFAIPLIGRWWPYEWVTEALALTGLIAIIGLIVIRQKNHPRGLARKSRFYGSVFWQAYYVELTILGVMICIALLRGLEGALSGNTQYSFLHYPFSYPLIAMFDGMSPGALKNGIILVALIKVLISMAWAITIALNITMGVAWHRFLAFFNIYFKRYPAVSTVGAPVPGTRSPSLGPLQPMFSAGKPIDFMDPGEDDKFGIGAIEDFTWKGILDFTTCTECGRCQSQCPAWATDKPLSPKLVILALRDHMYAKAPYLLATEEARAAADAAGASDGAGAARATDYTTPAHANASSVALLRGQIPATAVAEAARPLIGNAEANGVIDPDALWSCTTCGACVEQCPVDIEHVDHIVDMRRYQVLIESAFPSEAAGMLRNLENNGNPWGLPDRMREEWTAALDFEVRRIAPGQELGDDVEYLYFVGCAGSLEDRSRRTAQAFATLLHIADVNFAILGSAETCTGDPARRIGNEFVFQMLAQQNIETMNSVKARKVVVTCPHCFNSIANEYPQLGGNYEVVHHTMLLGKLIEEGRLTPIESVDKNITYHDPCYLGRHNRVYTPPREVLGAIPGIKSQEMHRCKGRGFCCGAGGARFWMEEKLGRRINAERTDEALELDPDLITTACPFCI
ncbi:MAG: (Fe-S)-binding protein, partial [Frankiaceae bacterium]|nr:(Fe-S)-binding protein [Frankiaceae bacterium]